MYTIKEQLSQRYKKLLLSKKEAANEIGVSEATIDRLRKSGQLKAKRIGGGVFFTINELVSFIES
jgi:DNA-binding Xre family transcriptional regulator